MKITPFKIVAGGVALFTLMFIFALVRVETPQTRQTAALHEIKETIANAVNVVDTVIEVPEETKIWALKRGYQLNNNSMVGSAMIDLTAERPDSIVMKTIRIMPTEEKNYVDSAADVEPVKQLQAQVPIETNTCTRHGMRKVVTGSSWRCKKK